jgi:hypothetical protein
LKFGIDRSTGKLDIGPVKVPLPASKGGRIAVGSALMAGGTLGFLPVLGFWMLPVGFVVVSNEMHAARKLRRKMVVKWGRRREKKD